MIKLKKFEWTEPAKSDGGKNSFYDHVKCNTSLGDFQIEWKCWKDYDTYGLYFNGEYVASLYTLDEAKQKAFDHIKKKIEEMLEQ